MASLGTPNAVAKGQISAPATNNSSQNPSIPQPMPAKEPLPVKKSDGQPVTPTTNSHLGRATVPAAPVPAPARPTATPKTGSIPGPGQPATATTTPAPSTAKPGLIPGPGQPANGNTVPAPVVANPVGLRPIPMASADAKIASLSFLTDHLSILVGNRGNYNVHDYEVRYGELMLSIKELLDLPPHLFALSLKLSMTRLDNNTLKIEIVDSHTNLIVGEFRIVRDDKRNLVLGTIPDPNKPEGGLLRRSDENITALAAKYADPFVDAVGMDPYLRKMAAFSHEMKFGRYANNFHEGEVEQLSKLYLGVDRKNWDRPIWSEFINTQSVGNNSMLIKFSDRPSQANYGIVGYHYGQQSPYPIVMVNGGNANQTAIDMVNEVRTDLKMPLIPRK